MKYLKNKGNKIVIGAFTSFFGKIIKSFFNYFSLIIVAQLLTTEDFGYYSIVSSIIVLCIQLAAFGFDKTIIKYYPSWRSYKENLNVNIDKTLLIMILISFVTFFITFGTGVLVSKLGEGNLGLMLMVFSFNIVIQAFMIYVRALNQAEHHYSKSVIPEDYIRPIIFMALLLITYFASPIDTDESILVALSFLLATLLSGLLSVFYMINIYRKHKMKLNIKNAFKESESVISYSFINMKGNILFHSKSHLVLLLASLFITPEMIGQLNIGIRTVSLITFLIVAVRNVFGPKIADLYYANNTHSLSLLYTKITSWISLIGILFCIILINNSVHMMNLFNYSSGYLTLNILVVGELFSIIFGSVNTFLVIINKHRQNTNLMTFSVATGIFLTLIMAPLYGINGVALSILISNLLANLLGVLILKTNINIRFIEYFIFKLLVIGAVCVGCMTVLKNYFNFNMLLEIFLITLITLVIYIVLVFLLTKQDVEKLINSK